MRGWHHLSVTLSLGDSAIILSGIGARYCPGSWLIRKSQYFLDFVYPVGFIQKADIGINQTFEKFFLDYHVLKEELMYCFSVLFILARSSDPFDVYYV